MSESNRMLFSIISVSKDNIEGIKNTFKSILCQSMQSSDFEWVIKDANSKDETSGYLRTVIQEYPLLNIKFNNSDDSGIYDGMNWGIDHSNGEYLIFMNSGDIFATADTLLKVRDAISLGNHSPALIIGDDIIKGMDGSETYRSGRDISYIKHSLPCSHQAIFYRRENIGSLRYSLKYKICSDYLFTLQIYLESNDNNFLKVNIPICIFEAGGHAVEKRSLMISEANDIKRKILDTPIWMLFISTVYSNITNYLLYNHPLVYKRIRVVADKIIATPESN
jgi:putative colanic acid biosynthesis glycosyltransferase